MDAVRRARADLPGPPRRARPTRSSAPRCTSRATPRATRPGRSSPSTAARSGAWRAPVKPRPTPRRSRRAVALQVELDAYPAGAIRAEDFRLVESALPAPGPGEVLVRNTWCSVDPGMRLQMRRVGPCRLLHTVPAQRPPRRFMAVGEVVEVRARTALRRETLSWHTRRAGGTTRPCPARAQGLGGIGTRYPHEPVCAAAGVSRHPGRPRA